MGDDPDHAPSPKAHQTSPVNRRCIFDGILHWVKTGAQWTRGVSRKLKGEVVKGSDDTNGFKLLPPCWVVGRELGWLMRPRRLARDHEAAEAASSRWRWTIGRPMAALLRAACGWTWSLHVWIDANDGNRSRADLALLFRLTKRLGYLQTVHVPQGGFLCGVYPANEGWQV